MTLLEMNKEINQLITNGYIEEISLNGKYKSIVTLKNNKIFYDGMEVGSHANTIDKRINLLCFDARRAYFIEEIFRSLGIVINDIENSYDVISSIETNIIFFKKSNKKYKFVSFYNSNYCDLGTMIKMVELDLNTNNLVYDRVDLKEMKYYHGTGKISDFTLEKINTKWHLYRITQNDLYDVIAEDAIQPKCSCAWSGMDEYGNCICDLDISKLNKNICEVEYAVENEKPKIYFL